MRYAECTMAQQKKQLTKEERERLLREIKPILDQVRDLQSTYEGDNHIWRALDNFRITDESTRLLYFHVIKDKLAHESKEQEAIDEARRELMMRDATRAEAHHRHLLGEDF